MNANTLPIDILPIAGMVNPARTGFTPRRSTSIEHRASRIGNEPANPTIKSYNVKTREPEQTVRKPRKSNFSNALKEHSEADDSAPVAGEQITPQESTKSPDTADNAGQYQVSTHACLGVLSQNSSIAMGETLNILANQQQNAQFVLDAAQQYLAPGSTGGRLAATPAVDGRLAVAGTATNVSEGQPPDQLLLQATPTAQTANPDLSGLPVSNIQLPIGNRQPVLSDVEGSTIDNPIPDQPVKSESHNAVAQSTKPADNQSSAQSNPDSLALPAETIVRNDNLAGVIEPKSGTKQGETNRFKNAQSANKSTGHQDTSATRPNPDSSGLDALAEKLGVEKMEMTIAKGAPQQLQSENSAASAVPAQANAKAVDVIIAARPAADTPKTADGADAAHAPAASIREQISQSVQGAFQQGQREITIQLNPPELGRVSIKLSEKGAEITGELTAANPLTRAEIRQQIPEIIRSLEQSGITVKRIDVTLSNLGSTPSRDGSDTSGRSNPDSQRDNYSQFAWDRSAGSNFNDSPHRQFSPDSFATHQDYLAPAFTGGRLAVAASATGYSSLDVLI